MAVALLLLSAVGHPAPADERLSTIEGQVVLDGQPLAAGKIFFYLDDDQFVGSKVKEGAFKMSRAPVGVWRVAIEGETVPPKFASERTSPLRVDVREGRNVFDFNLRR